MTESRQLLRKYVLTGSEAAFAEIVTRYVDLVHSTAFRLVENDSQLAQDVVQTVFVDLAQQASVLSRDVMLGGWLHRHTCFVAAKAMRRERRRQERERQAAEMRALEGSGTEIGTIAPVLDEAINELGEEDRKAILLRFYERLDLRSIGEALGSSENAAQKRVSRALEQLHALLTQRGVTLSVTALGTVLAAGAVTAAPAGLAASVAGAASVGATTFMNVALMSKAKFSILAITIAGVVTSFVVQRHDKLRLLEENQSLRQQTAQLERYQSEVERLSSDLAESKVSKAVSNDQPGDVLRLRGEIGVLRNERIRLEERLAGLATNAEHQLSPQTAALEASFTVPKEAWTNRGYATPDAALQSALWALRESDTQTFLASLTPEARKRVQDSWAAKPERGGLVKPPFPLSEILAFTIKKQENLSDDEVKFLLYVPETPTKTQLADGSTASGIRITGLDVLAKRQDGEWKLDVDW